MIPRPPPRPCQRTEDEDVTRVGPPPRLPQRALPGGAPAPAPPCSASSPKARVLDPAFPNPAAQVRLGGSPGHIHGALLVAITGNASGRQDLEVTWDQAANHIQVTLDAEVVALGAWRAGRVVELSWAPKLPAETIGRLTKAVVEIGHAFERARHDRDLAHAAALAPPAIPVGLPHTSDEARQLREEANRARGLTNEAVILERVVQAVGALPWVERIRKATRTEDQRGIEASVERDGYHRALRTLVALLSPRRAEPEVDAALVAVEAINPYFTTPAFLTGRPAKEPTTP